MAGPSEVVATRMNMPLIYATSLPNSYDPGPEAVGMYQLRYHHRAKSYKSYNSCQSYFTFAPLWHSKMTTS